MCCQNHDVEVGAEPTPVHEETVAETEFVALPGFQVCRAPLSVALSPPEAAKTSLADQTDVSQETKTSEIHENQDQMVRPGPEAVVLVLDGPSDPTEGSLFELFHLPNHQRTMFRLVTVQFCETLP